MNQITPKYNLLADRFAFTQTEGLSLVLTKELIYQLPFGEDYGFWHKKDGLYERQTDLRIKKEVQKRAKWVYEREITNGRFNFRFRRSGWVAWVSMDESVATEFEDDEKAYIIASDVVPVWLSDEDIKEVFSDESEAIYYGFFALRGAEWYVRQVFGAFQTFWASVPWRVMPAYYSGMDVDKRGEVPTKYLRRLPHFPLRVPLYRPYVPCPAEYRRDYPCPQWTVTDKANEGNEEAAKVLEMASVMRKRFLDAPGALPWANQEDLRLFLAKA
ncbi:hypothetical protein [Candidatus Igneacidithiobacillus taiwanensis]|uniref:hypothetical protein n=1 Tax=Candidatus Igneacidithiobacillus taiwanensis TaxID=1945924 RepID=UPI00289FC481|nr:hypothetical protein [Candidatus Igneacidithiobacillus taiwanensis]